MSSVSRQWRSLEQLADDPSFIARAAQEFPGLAEALASPHDRRRVLKLMAAAFAMGGLGGCDAGAPEGVLIPAVRMPPNIIPALPNFYSTADVLDGYANGVVVKHQMGRPIKVEGNPLHPASLGATDALAQAQVLEFYDPDRSWGITARSLPSDRQNLLTALTEQRIRTAETHGAGFRILTGTITSPTLGAQLDALLSRYPQARWHQWEPVSRDNIRKGAGLAYGQPVEVVPRLDKADVVLAIDSDLLSSAPGHLRFARDFASRRNPARTQKMLRLYAVEPTPTLTGSVADHRFIAGPRELHQVVTALAAGILQQSPPSAAPDWIGKVITDLTANPGRALVHVGPNQPPETHALVHAINEKLRAPGATLELIAPVIHSTADHTASLSDLVDDMHAGKVSSLLIIDSNPAYAAPGGLGFAEALKRVDFSLTLAAAPNETSNATVWGIPMAHAWESWSDARAYDGTATILQPQALPLYQGTSTHGMLAPFTDPSPSPTRYCTGHLEKSSGCGFRKRLARRAGRRRRAEHRQSESQRVAAPGRRTSDAASAARPSADHPVSSRSASVGRTLRQQRLAAGTAATAHEADLGQSAADLPGSGAKIEPAEWRHGAPHHGRCARDGAGLDHAGPGGGLRRGAARLRPTQRRHRRQRHRLRLLSADRPDRCPGAGEGGRSHGTGQHRSSRPDFRRDRRHRQTRHAGRIRQGPALSRLGGAATASVSPEAGGAGGLGDERRSQRLHRLQRLLRSHSDAHPKGLANGSDQVGRNYIRHNMSIVMALLKEPNHTVFQKTLAFSDYYFDADDWEYPLGLIQMCAKPHGEQIRGEALPGYLSWLPEMPFEKMAEHSIDFWLQSEDLPRPENRIRYDGDRVVLDIHEGNLEAAARLRAKLEDLLTPLGAWPHLIERRLYLGKNVPIGGTAHQAGTCRFGNDPASSVLDLDCKAHELDNLYITDASFFPSIGAVNPTLTIIANALRVSDRIKERLGA